MNESEIIRNYPSPDKSLIPDYTALDVVLYGAHFVGMKLAGMIFIAVGFFLVMFPDNWPDYITRLLRYVSHKVRVLYNAVLWYALIFKFGVHLISLIVFSFSL